MASRSMSWFLVLGSIGLLAFAGVKTYGPRPTRIKAAGTLLASLLDLPRSLPYPSNERTGDLQGVLVAELHISASGRVTNVNVLQAPSKSFGDSVSTSLRRLTSSPPKDSRGRPAVVAGKVILYFVIQNDTRRVLAPEEMAALRRSASN